MLNISLKPNRNTTKITYSKHCLDYGKIFGSNQWRLTFLQTFAYVLLNIGIVMLVSIPAAYAFSRHMIFGQTLASGFSQTEWHPVPP